MIVDSRYAFTKLKERLNGQDILAAYNMAKVLRLKAACGWFYEEILHRRFRELAKTTNAPIQEWMHREDISGADGVASFVAKCKQKTDIYWAPPIPNFANIDAAVLQKSRILIVFSTLFTKRTSLTKTPSGQTL